VAGRQGFEPRYRGPESGGLDYGWLRSAKVCFGFLDASPVCGGGVYRIIGTAEETAGRHFAFEAIEPPGGGPPLHIHAAEDEYKPLRFLTMSHRPPTTS
jgi:hypothetical protein